VYHRPSNGGFKAPVQMCVMQYKDYLPRTGPVEDLCLRRNEKARRGLLRPGFIHFPKVALRRSWT
jgi:hypothetical protein